MSLLSSIDLFSYRFGFHYKGRNEYKTDIGGIISIFFVIFLGIASFYQSLNLINRKHPKISIKEDSIDQAAGIDLSQNTVILAFQMEGLTTKDLFPNNLFKMEVIYYDDYTNISTTIIDNTFELVSCRILSGYAFENLVKQNIELYVNGICLKFPPRKKYDLKNTLINISFYCLNYADTNCMFNQVFQDRILDKSVTFYYLGLNVDVDETDNVFNNKLESFQVIINPILSTKADLFYEFSKVESDLGIVYEFIKEKTTISAKSYTFNNIFNYKLNKGQIKLFNLNVYFRNNRKIYRRIYYKLQNLFAELGGIINITLIIGKIILYLFNKKSFETDIINDIFSVKDVYKLNLVDSKIKPDQDELSINKNIKNKTAINKESQNQEKSNLKIKSVLYIFNIIIFTHCLYYLFKYKKILYYLKKNKEQIHNKIKLLDKNTNIQPYSNNNKEKKK